MLIRKQVALFVLSAAAAVVDAQFKCTFAGAKDASSCTAVTDDGSQHCAWCSVSSSTSKSSGKSNVQVADDFGFCVSESQAEAMEQSIPNVHCDRYDGSTDDAAPPQTDDATDDYGPAPPSDDYSPSDDQAPPSDDQAPPSDDQAPPAVDDAFPPPSDDAMPPTDDQVPPATDDQAPPPPPSTDDDNNNVPDNYWTCLQKKTSATCAKANCTWCDTKGGFGLCLTGPSADSAANSDWYTCSKPPEPPHTETAAAEVKRTSGKSDTTCLSSFPTEHACVTNTDAEGVPCEWCSLLDLTHVCLSADQAATGGPLGVSCDSKTEAKPAAIATPAVDDPYDPSCLLVYLQDPSEDACEAATDADGASCKFCTLQGSIDMCLNAEQAQAAQPIGVTCDDDAQVAPYKVVVRKNDPTYDTSCMVTYLHDQTETGCVASVDMDGVSCEYCDFGTPNGGLAMCLTSTQVELAASLGVSCHSTAIASGDETTSAQAATLASPAATDPYDPSCLLAYLEDSSEDACLAAVDADGNTCEFCSLQGALDLCLTTEQGEMAEQTIGMSCTEQKLQDPYDPSCLLAYLEDSSEEACVAASDADGNSCRFCSLQGALDVCLTAEQAEIGEQTIGMTCQDEREPIQSPYDPTCMLEYMEKSSKSACTSAVDVAGHPCEYCTAKGASTLCLNPEQAKAAKQDLNYKCARKDAALAIKDPYDPTCALAYLADPTEAACVQSNDADGKSCEYCTLQGLNLCLNSEQADIGIGIGIDCDDSNKSSPVADPLDTSCMSAFWTDQSEEVCVAAVDQDGKPCQYCSLPDSIVLCLTSDQAAIGQALGMDCTTDFGLVLPALAMAVKP